MIEPISSGLGIHIADLSMSYQQRETQVEVLSHLNLNIAPGSFVSVVGPSGCGKSTLLRLIAGLTTPQAGALCLTSSAVSDSDVRMSARKTPPLFANEKYQEATSFVFQEANLLPWLTVEENVQLPFELSKALAQVPRLERGQRVLESLQKVALQDSRNLFPAQLSGGMKMRVSLARALVNRPRLLLLDEPFAALDENTRFEMQNQLLELWYREKMTVVFVTHSLFEAAYLSQRVILIKGTGAQIQMDLDLQKEFSLPSRRTEDLRTSEVLNTIVKHIATRLRQ